MKKSKTHKEESCNTSKQFLTPGDAFKYLTGYLYLFGRMPLSTCAKLLWTRLKAITDLG